MGGMGGRKEWREAVDALRGRGPLRVEAEALRVGDTWTAPTPWTGEPLATGGDTYICIKQSPKIFFNELDVK